MSLEAVKSSYRDALVNVGKAGLNVLFPNDINLYFLAMELVDSRGVTVNYLAWPILPEEIKETHMEITTIRKTISSVNVLKNPTFAPRQISIKGNFGRNFKILLNRGIEFAGFGISNGSFTSTNLLNGNEIAQFSSFAKTGYGCIKIIEAMKEGSKKLDAYNKPHSLYLYNPILGNNYQVEFSTGGSFSHTQNNKQNNMIPAYDIQLTAVALLNGLFDRVANVDSALKNLSIGVLQKGANTIASSIRSAI